MFKDLRTGTKLVLLCALFLIAIGATTYSLVREKLIAIEFARKELVGTKDLAMIRELYERVLTMAPFDPVSTHSIATQRDTFNTLARSLDDSALLPRSEAEPARALDASIEAWGENPQSRTLALGVLAAAQQLAIRIADQSNLTLDPDLDSYYLQNLVSKELPALLRDIGELNTVVSDVSGSSGSLPSEQAVRSQLLEGRLHFTADGIEEHVSAAYRGNVDGSVRAAIDDAVVAMLSSARAYISAMSPGSPARNSDEGVFGQAVENALKLWTVSEQELNRLLQNRVDGLLGRMRRSLVLTAALSGLSIIIALMTHWHLVRPLRQLEDITSSVRQSKDYGLRMDYRGKDEVGTLASAFNDMLAELAAAREREQSEQSELARAARLTTMGAMTASIAHEINQPLAAIVANGNAAQRFLSITPPDLDEVRGALKDIVMDGQRASHVIGSVRAIFKKESTGKRRLVVNDVIEDVLTLVRGEIRKHGVSLSKDLLASLPDVEADRTQLQQVILNLVMNAVEALAQSTHPDRSLIVRSDVFDARHVVVEIEDSGPGFDANDKDRIFDAFYTTKSEGMGMGLFICRSIVEAHGGRLWASPGKHRGSVFHVVLPRSE